MTTVGDRTRQRRSALKNKNQLASLGNILVKGNKAWFFHPEGSGPWPKILVSLYHPRGKATDLEFWFCEWISLALIQRVLAGFGGHPERSEPLTQISCFPLNSQLVEPLPETWVRLWFYSWNPLPCLSLRMMSLMRSFGLKIWLNLPVSWFGVVFWLNPLAVPLLEHKHGWDWWAWESLLIQHIRRLNACTGLERIWRCERQDCLH